MASGRAGVGAARTNRAVASPRAEFGSGLVHADRPGVWRYVGSLQSKHNIAEKDMMDIALGEGNTPRHAQFARDA